MITSRDPHLKLSLGHHGWIGIIFLFLSQFILGTGLVFGILFACFVYLLTMFILLLCKLSWNEIGHFLLLMSCGFMALGVFAEINVIDFTWKWIFPALGLWLTNDDIYQHSKQHFKIGYRSPVHKLWAKLYYKIKLIRNLEAKFKSWF